MTIHENASVITRRPSPVGRLRKPRILVCRAARQPYRIMLNRYPGQVIGVGFRLPRWLQDGTGGCDLGLDRLYLSIVWAEPSRWWR